MATDPALSKSPREARHARLLRVALETAEGEARAFVLRNISERGCGVIARGERLFSGEKVNVVLPTGHSLAGEVRWSGNGGFGIRFERRLDVEGLTPSEPLPLIPARNPWDVSRRHRPRPSSLRSLGLRRI